MKELTYFNGEMVESGAKVVSLDDRGYCFGDGVYEVVRVYNGRAFAFSYHQDRLYRSMRDMDIPVRMPPDELQELHEIMIEQSEITDGYIYLQITRGVTPRHHAFERSKLEPQMYMFIKPITTDLGALQEGVKAITLPDERWARVDMKDGVCYTHPANHHILKGITRQLVVTRVAPTAGITIIEREFDEAFLKDADEIFFTDTIGGIIPITTLNREPVGDGKPGKAAKVLAEQLQHLMEEGLA